jgi:vitamin B12 transporter
MLSLTGLLGMLVLAGGGAGATAPDGDTTARSAGGAEERTARRTIEEESEEYYDLVVTASRTPESIEHIGSSVTVITSEDLEARRENSVIEVLRAVPGVSVTTSGGPGTTSSIRIRGANDVHTLVLLDGVRVHSNTLGSASIQNLTIDNIDRIEVVRGPQSVLYGSDAMGGVIQIFTKKGTANRSSVSYEGGSYNSNLVRASTMGVSDNQSFSVAGSWQEIEGYSRFNEKRGAIEDDGYRNQSASVAWKRTGWLDLGANLWFSEGEIDLDRTTGDNRTQYSQNREWSAAFDFSRHFGERWFHQAKISGFQDEQVGNTGADFRINSVTRAAKWQSEFRLNDALRMIGGFESEKQIGESLSGGVTRFAQSTITNSGYFEGLLGYRDFHVTLGGRHDNHSSFGDHNTWRTTAAWTGLENTRLFGSYGTGFKAPTFNQLFFPGIGTLTLQPEESKGWDAGLEHSFLDDRIVIRGTYFENDFENLIEFAAPTFIARNVAQAATNGVELSGTVKFRGNLSLDAQYTYLESRDEINNLRLQRRPENGFTAHLSYQPVPSLDLDLYYRNTGPSFSATNEKNRVDGYDLLAAVVAYRFRDRHKVWFRGENLLDEEYEEVVPFGTPGAAYYGGYEFTF